MMWPPVSRRRIALSLAMMTMAAHEVFSLFAPTIRIQKISRSAFLYSNRNNHACRQRNIVGRGNPLFSSVGEAVDVQVALFTIFSANLPYLLNLVIPKVMTNTFFLPVYKTSEQLQEEGRPPKDWNAGERAYIYWECMYAVLGLSLATVSYIDTFVASTERLVQGLEIDRVDQNSLSQVISVADAAVQNLLRDDITLWALFYIAAFVKIFIECRVYNIVKGNYWGIQLWHLLVAAVLIACVATPPIEEERT